MDLHPADESSGCRARVLVVFSRTWFFPRYASWKTRASKRTPWVCWTSAGLPGGAQTSPGACFILRRTKLPHHDRPCTSDRVGWRGIFEFRSKPRRGCQSGIISSADIGAPAFPRFRAATEIKLIKNRISAGIYEGGKALFGTCAIRHTFAFTPLALECVSPGLTGDYAKRCTSPV